MTIEAIEFDNASDAAQYAEAGIAFAYLCDHEMPDGMFRIMTVPVN